MCAITKKVITMVNAKATLRAYDCLLVNGIKTEYGHHECHYSAPEFFSGAPDSSGYRVWDYLAEIVSHKQLKYNRSILFRIRIFTRI